jgi:membrane-associated protein
VGRWFGPKLHQTAFAQKRMSEIAKSEAFILKYGTLSVIGGRLIPAVRSLVPMMIGISGTSRLKFSLVDLVACAVWITGLGLLVVGIESLMS